MKIIYLITICFSGLIISYAQINSNAYNNKIEKNNFVDILKLAKYYSENNADSSIYFADNIINNNKANDSLKGYACLYKGIALHSLSKYNEEKNAFTKALYYFEKSKKDKSKAEVYTNLGNLHSKLADYEKAMKYYLEAKKIHETTNNYDGLFHVNQAIGVMYFEKGDLKRAKEYLYGVTKYFSQKKSTTGKADVFTNIAGIYWSENKLDSSLYFFKLSLNEALKSTNIDKIAVTYNNIGHTYNSWKQPDSAIPYFQKSIAYYNKMNNYGGICIANSGLGTSYLMLKNYSQAEKHYQIAISTAEKNNIRKFAINQYKLSSKLYAELKNYKKAYDLLITYIKMKDSLENDNKNRLLEEMQAKYEYDKQENKIAFLKEQEFLKDERRKQVEQKNKMLFIALTGIIILISITAFFIWRSYNIKKETNNKLILQNLEIAQQNKEIKDSIKYAKRIQEAILPPHVQIKKLLADYFILYKPKDIVSGDFFWVEEKNDIVYFAVVDCTGHGVPGAFMSIVGRNGLNDAINMLNNPNAAEILDYLNYYVNQSLHQTYETSTVRDGMDISLCVYNKQKKILQFAGANNSLWQIKNKDGELVEIKADKQPIGNYVGYHSKPFTNHTVSYQSGDRIYLLSDGYADQFGGPKGKKFKYSRLKELIINAYHKTFNEQLQLLDEEFEKWKGNLEQIDDVCIMGIKLI